MAIRKCRALHRQARARTGPSDALEAVPGQKPTGLERTAVLVPVGWSGKMGWRERGHQSPRRQSQARRGARLSSASSADFRAVPGGIKCGCSRAANLFGGSCRTGPIGGILPGCLTRWRCRLVEKSVVYMAFARRSMLHLRTCPSTLGATSSVSRPQRWRAFRPPRTGAQLQLDRHVGQQCTCERESFGAQRSSTTDDPMRE